MEQKTIIFTHASGIKSYDFPSNELNEVIRILDKCLKGDLHALTHFEKDGSDTYYPASYLQNSHIEIKDKVIPKIM